MARNYGLRDKFELELEAELRKAVADLLDYSRANGIRLGMDHATLGKLIIDVTAAAGGRERLPAGRTAPSFPE